MIDLPVYDANGQQTGTVPLDEAKLGGKVRVRLLKQAIVMYQAARHQATAATKSRGMIAGSTRKLFRQKGTGNARMGPVRTGIRRGGGVTFAKQPRDMSKDMPKKMRRLARNSAILAKAQAEEAAVIDELSMDAPKTRTMAGLLKNVGADRGCLLALGAPSENIWKSARNIPRTDVCLVGELNAYAILRRRKLLLTREAYDALMKDPVRPGIAGADV
jgi:large subunit ribosomal protein L4